MTHNLRASSSPHIRDGRTTRGIMFDVAIALLPAALFGAWRFGANAIMVLAVAVITAVLTELLIEVIFKKPRTISDGSAVVTGLLLGMSLPPDVPFWIPLIGSFFAIAVVKMLFGGLGFNFMNPALTARAVLLASWPSIMTTWKFVDTVEATASATTVSSATPIEAVHYGTASSYGDLFFGNIAGSIGEVSKLLLLIGAAYLLIRGVIKLYIPLSTLVTVFLFTWAFGGDGGLFTGDGLYAILSGSVIIGAFFMATDYTTSPTTPKGQIIMGFGVGLMVFIIRTFGNYPEGVTYAIIFMNIVVPLIDRYTQPKLYGGGKRA
ncbi:RnfABCDGE type electron transport complex subunit D [Eubacteriales bacterium OttesenSCG-928-M02]|nr:RnfABCDGE type electron transport complex subunit D [Eubacteriales bacterium OttesenSCG-928-M02]